MTESNLVPSSGENAGGMATYNKANASGAIVAPPPDVLGGGLGFSETWKIDKDKNCFVNRKTSEERADLFIVVSKTNPNRVLFENGERKCWSDDANNAAANAPLAGVECASCPQISESERFNKYYEANTDKQRPQYIGNCNLRYGLFWNKEFVMTEAGLTLYDHVDRVMLSCPKSSIYALFGRSSYLGKLEEMGLDITVVVTRVVVARRMNDTIKSEYAYANFEFAGKVEDLLAQVVQTVTVEAKDDKSEAAPAAAPASAAPASFPGQAAAPAAAPAAAAPNTFPGMAPAAAPAPAAVPGATTAAPAAAAPAPAAFPGTVTAAAPATAEVPPGTPAGLPPAQPPAAAVPTGLPPVQPPVAAAPAAQPPAAVPAAQPPAAVPPAQPPAEQPSIEQMAKQNLIKEFSALPEKVKPIVLNVLQIGKIEDVPNEKVATAVQAVKSAVSYGDQAGGQTPAASPNGDPAPAAAPAGAPAPAQTGGKYPF